MIYLDYCNLIIPLILGFILDLLLGDPHWLPHPVRLFGRIISSGEKRLNNKTYKIFKGGLFIFLLVSGTWLLLFIAFSALEPYPVFFYPVASVMVFYGLANHSLITEVLKVNRKLKKKGIEAGRKQLSFIVGRDTTGLSGNQVRIATLETLSENLSDGVVAPLFYYAIGGIPLMFAYKIVNTLDSMIGYKNERFKEFGMFAARADDILNFIPARLTALLMVLVSFSKRGFYFIFKYGHKHSSPNSGYPEAALAGILNCRFGGPNTYNGVLVNKPFIGYNERIITGKCITKACSINLIVSFVCVSGIIAITYILSR